MKTESLDTIYSKIDKQISLVESYTEIKNLSFIIKSCRLKPYNYLFNKRNHNIILNKWWVDEFGNSLKLVGKRVYFIFNDLKVNHQDIVNTDLYSGLTIPNLIKISKLIYISYGIEEDFYQPYYHISLLGIDNYLRSYLYAYDQLESVAPLSLGIKNLKIIAAHKDIKYFSSFSKKENSLLPCTNAKQWISSIPAHSNFIQEMKKDHPVIYNLFKETQD
jgi:hypothetical protein